MFMRFSYSCGQRPLDGFTIKRGVGTGGFGEVYFALSDGGKEVALKTVRGHQEIELRGIAQCLNLKHPNLVHLYDLRTDAKGDPWVVMEYVSGDPLSLVLNRYPQGVPVGLVKQWFGELAKAVSHLHEHGVVHRDLKPANVFLENGVLKVGDYGLAKSISASARTAQTQSVGTVHYMAPEIGTGNYNKQIDIYACGVLLFELLTGKVPFEGESAAEVMMKHLTTPPNLSQLPTEWAGVIGRALAKNPVHRFATMAEFAYAVERIGGSLLLTLPAAPSVVELKPVVQPNASRSWPSVPRSWRDSAREVAESFALSAGLALLATMIGTALLRESVHSWQRSGQMFFTTVGLCWVVLGLSKAWPAKPTDSWLRRLALMIGGASVGVLSLWLDGWSPNPAARDDPFYGLLTVGRDGVAAGAGYLSYYGLALGAQRWWKLAERRRKQRFSLFGVIAAAFWGLVLYFVWPWPNEPFGAVALVATALIVQTVSPWDAPPPAAPRRLRWRQTLPTTTTA
jgi:serine/threonine protein kinase